MAAGPEPTEHARVLVRGGYDLHVHIAPDVPRRRIDDVALAAPLRRARARRVRAQVALHLDRRARAGRLRRRGRRARARDADAQPGDRRDERARRRDRRPRGGAHRLDADRRLAGGDRGPDRAEAGRQGADLGEAPARAARARARRRGGARDRRRRRASSPETRDVLPHDRAARARARDRRTSAATTPSRSSTRRSQEGVETVVVTHPEFTCQRFSVEDQVALAARGCLFDRCLSTPLSGKADWSYVFEGVRAVGLERNVFSSDFGNPDYPPVEDGLALWADTPARRRASPRTRCAG